VLRYLQHGALIFLFDATRCRRQDNVLLCRTHTVFSQREYCLAAMLQWFYVHSRLFQERVKGGFGLVLASALFDDNRFAHICTPSGSLQALHTNTN